MKDNVSKTRRDIEAALKKVNDEINALIDTDTKYVALFKEKWYMMNDRQRAQLRELWAQSEATVRKEYALWSQ